MTGAGDWVWGWARVIMYSAACLSNGSRKPGISCSSGWTSRTPSQAPGIARRGARGVAAGSSFRMAVRLEVGRTRKSALRIACQLRSGTNRGGGRGVVPRGSLRSDPGRSEWMRDKARASREMHEPDAVAAASTGRRLQSDLRVPVPAESEPASVRESEKCFPKKNTLPAGRCGREGRARRAQPRFTDCAEGRGDDSPRDGPAASSRGPTLTRIGILFGKVPPEPPGTS
jgi:hypothetical protein